MWKLIDHRKPEAPCQGCEDRTVEPNCHMTCEKFLKYDAMNKKLQKERIKTAEENRVQNDIEKRRIKMASEGRMYRKKKGE